MNELQVSVALRKAFDEHCTKPGPSIDPEKFKTGPVAPGLRLADSVDLMGGRF